MDTTGFKDRFEALGDIEELLKVAAPQYRSPQVYFEELIANEKDKKLAEKRLRVLEDMLVRDEEERAEKALERLVRERNELLKETDWTQLPDVPLTQEDKKLYRKYRQYLRELPQDIKSGKLKCELKKFKEWKEWLTKIAYLPGYNKYIP